MWYEVHPTPVKGADGKNLVYVRPKSGLKLSMSELEDYCEGMNSLRYGELSRAFDAFIRAAGRFLAEGYRIDTPIGSFAPRLVLTKQITDASEVKDRDVRLEGVEYNPDGTVKSETTEYTDGSGSVTFSGSTAKWNDDAENDGDTMVFDYVIQ